MRKQFGSVSAKANLHSKLSREAAAEAIATDLKADAGL
jgi:hypothetical protein